MKDEKIVEVRNVFEAGSNCQVFNAPISGCIFAMPDSNITQNPVKPAPEVDDKAQECIGKLKSMFFGDEEEARNFLQSVQGMKGTQITALVNKLATERKLSDRLIHRDLWKVLHDCGIYDKSESNWNSQVK